MMMATMEMSKVTGKMISRSNRIFASGVKRRMLHSQAAQANQRNAGVTNVLARRFGWFLVT